MELSISYLLNLAELDNGKRLNPLIKLEVNAVVVVTVKKNNHSSASTS